jgi:hypothetical protein
MGPGSLRTFDINTLLPRGTAECCQKGRRVGLRRVYPGDPRLTPAPVNVFGRRIAPVLNSRTDLSHFFHLKRVMLRPSRDLL